MSPVEIIDLTISSPEHDSENSAPPLSHNRRKIRSATSSTAHSTSSEVNDRTEPQSKRGSNESQILKDTEVKKNAVFYVDLNPASLQVPTNRAVPDETDGTEGKLLLPLHVTVLGRTPVENVAPPEFEDDDFIQYLEYEETKDAVRYFHQPSDESVILERTVCKKCGAEGLHKTSACTVQICLTCGARNEHSTRSCPISKVCFTCGMKGHIIANCPNRSASRNRLSHGEQECGRCSESTHKTDECPTWWRLYEYVSGEDRGRILGMRQTKRDVELGAGGEGYVANDEWCYNCGNVGHWGDDCEVLADLEPSDHSAFSKANVMNGPFYDPNDNHGFSTSRSRVRDWEKFDKLSVMDVVGRRGRLKTKAALENQATQARDDTDDWFSNPTRRLNPAPSRHPRSQEPQLAKRLSFRRYDNDGGRYAAEERRGPPGLLQRMGMAHHGGSVSDRPPPIDREERHRQRYRDKPRHLEPRYKGGYRR